MARVGPRRGLLACVLLASLLLVPGGRAAAQSCVGGTENDFNGDGASDVAIADPDATVDHDEAAGRVHVVYGDGAGSQTISQDSGFVTGSDGETGDRFGFSLAAVDYNEDGCTDLVVGVPFETFGEAVECGVVHVLFGSPSGFGPNGSLQLDQSTAGMPGGRESGDRFGWSLAAGESAGGDPFVVIGVPGEGLLDSSDVQQPDAGAVVYVSGSTMRMRHQGSANVPGAVERGDQFALSVGASPRHVVAGASGEAIGSEQYSGTMQVFENALAGYVGGWDQNGPGETGAPEAGDWCGRDVSMTEFIPPGGSAGDVVSVAAVGCPGEAHGDVRAGRMVLVTADTDESQLWSVSQTKAGVTNSIEEDDYFGWSVEVVNRSPGSAVGWEDLVVAAGVPGKDGGGRTDAGGVHVFSGVGAPGDHDVWFDSGELTGGLWSPRDDARAGQFMGSSSTHLYVADPFGSPPAVYAVPWQNLVEGASDPVRVFEPGADGLPTDGVGMFGAAIV